MLPFAVVQKQILHYVGAVDSVVSSSSVLVEQHLNLFRRQLKLKLLQANIDTSIVDDVTVDTGLDAFSSHSKRMTFLGRILRHILNHSLSP
jgi:hypothetical protein